MAKFSALSIIELNTIGKQCSDISVYLTCIQNV